MNRMSWKIGCGALMALLWVHGPQANANTEFPYRAERQKAQQQSQNGNFQDALNTYTQFMFEADVNETALPSDASAAVDSLRRLNQEHEADALREKLVEKHPTNWRLLKSVSESYRHANHTGYVVAGEFRRGHHRGGGEAAHVMDRDRIRALQLLVQAMPLVEKETSTHAAAQFYLHFANVLLQGRGMGTGWKLNVLSNLNELPDVEEGYPYWRYRHGSEGPQGAPVDEDGNPVFHAIPESFDAATTDGERWRWLTWKAMQVEPQVRSQAMYAFAEYLHGQFGVQTLVNYGWYFNRTASDNGDKDRDTSGTWELHTLAQNESIARLASGVKRIQLPDEYCFLKIYRELSSSETAATAEAGQTRVAEILLNRRQYPEAANAYRDLIERFGPGYENQRQHQLDQIVDNWGELGETVTQPAGEGARLTYRFRNGSQVRFSAHRIHVEKLLDDVRDYIKSNPAQLNWDRLQIGNIGYMLVEKERKQYVGDEVASWTLDLKPSPKHFDRRVTVSTPLEQAGAYLVTAAMENGNSCQVIVWVSDLAIVKKALAQGEKNEDVAALYFVADARTGAPARDATLDFFGYWQEHLNQRWKTRNANFRTTRFAETSDRVGLVLPSRKDLLVDADRSPQWIITATTDDGRFAYLGFTHVWSSNYYDHEYNQSKCYGITDRPVYRPDQAVQFKFWVRQAKYDQEDVSRFAGNSFHVRFRNPRGDEVHEATFTADDVGGFDGEYLLPEDAQLGVYSATVDGYGSTTFRVEEYKKPEFEVTVEAPTEPVMLGESVEATIHAKYYFGAPVTEADVSYKITRTPHNGTWYPAAPWDWFYGKGYWWFSYDYEWYPGWWNWGCVRPVPFWWPSSHEPPEVVVQQDVKMGKDGTVKIVLDTSLAKAIHGDQDHEYQITADVTDRSRRTIVGQGNVLVARRPFRVYAWVDRGYYQMGDVIQASFSAQTLDQNPVTGEGSVVLYNVAYDEDGKPREEVVQEWDLPTDAQGKARLEMKASEAGQYRLLYRVVDVAGHEQEGGYMFVVRGDGRDGSNYRFNHLELVTDQQDYRAGDTVKLLVNTDRKASTVLVFVRASNGTYLPPQVVQVDGKSHLFPIEVSQRDMPNFFVEALTVSDGKVYTEVREIVVPPEERVLNVDVEPSAKELLPGSEAIVKIRLTELDGTPYQGSAVVTVYDKSVEYISGGSNVPDIKEFFWKWRRTHHPQTEHSLARRFLNLTPKGQVALANLGVFGHSVADELDAIGAMGGSPRRELRAVASQSPLTKSRSFAVGMAAPASMDMVMEESVADHFESPRKQDGGRRNLGEAGAIAEQVEPAVRSEFADTAFWVASLETDEKGVAEVKFDMPENLTGWKIRTWAVGHGTKVGEGTADVVTTKNLVLRLQAPRFFVEKDEVVLSANIHNYLETKKDVEAILELDGGTVEPIGELVQTVSVEPNGEQRVDWRVKVVREGEVVVRMKALTDEESDAMQMSFPVYVHGMLKTDSFSGVLRPDDKEGSLEFMVPLERRVEQTRVEVRYSPTVAAAIVDALPYLVDYPYGCTEQTLSRFLPTVITQKILLDLGLDLVSIRDKRTNLNAREIGDDQERAGQWQRWDRNPVFSEVEVTRMAKDGLKALYDMQLSDGGWGWFSGYGERSYPHTTAYIVHGLQMAEANGLTLVPGVLQRGIAWLQTYEKEQVHEIQNEKKGKSHADNLDAFTFMVLADAGKKNDDMLEFLLRDRAQHLSVYGKTKLGIALHKLEMVEERDQLIHNIEQFLKQDAENQTTYLDLPNHETWWYWYGSEFEAHAYYLKLLALTEPNSEKASGLATYLLNNRKHATYWNSTRDTAICIEALADYLKASGEAAPNLTLELVVDGVKKKQVELSKDNLFTFDNKLVLTGASIEGGKHVLELRKTGEGRLYYNAYVTYFSLEDTIAKSGLEVKVDRDYYKLVQVDKQVDVAGSRGQAVAQAVEKFRREKVENLATLASGDLVEIELIVESKNDYEYLVFEDMKPAGFEPVDVRSGYNGNEMGAYVEFRDEKVVFFIRRLARGRHSLSYRMRAEIPGKFSALPTRGYAMYAPELRANSDEMKVWIEDESTDETRVAP